MGNIGVGNYPELGNIRCGKSALWEMSGVEKVQVGNIRDGNSLGGKCLGWK